MMKQTQLLSEILKALLTGRSIKALFELASRYRSPGRQYWLAKRGTYSVGGRSGTVDGPHLLTAVESLFS